MIIIVSIMAVVYKMLSSPASTFTIDGMWNPNWCEGTGLQRKGRSWSEGIIITLRHAVANLR
jgi:hypothetical protein